MEDVVTKKPVTPLLFLHAHLVPTRDENGQLSRPCIYRFSVPVLTYLRNDDWSVSTFDANDCPVSHHCFRHSDLLLLPAHLQQASFDSFIHGLFHNIIVGIFCCFAFLETS